MRLWTESQFSGTKSEVILFFFFPERKLEEELMNAECQPHLSISWNFLSLFSLLIFTTSFEHTELTSQRQK